jgi:hypothetical protein
VMFFELETHRLRIVAATCYWPSSWHAADGVANC